MPLPVELTGVQPGCSVVVVTGADVVEVGTAGDDAGDASPARPGDAHPKRTSPSMRTGPVTRTTIGDLTDAHDLRPSMTNR